MVVSAIGIFTNGVLIFVILVDPLHILKRGPWITILNLSIADFTASLSEFMIVGLSKPFQMIQVSHQLFRCVQFILTLGTTGSFFNLASLTIQIYVITKYPIRSRHMLSRKKIYVICATIWFVAFGLALWEMAFIVFNLDFSQIMILYITLFSVLLILIALQLMLKSVIAKEVIHSQQNMHMNGRQHNKNKHLQIAKIIFLLNMFLYVTAFPYVLAHSLEHMFKLRKAGSKSLVLFRYYYVPLAMLNFAVNPIVYALRLVNYHNSLKSFVSKE